MHRIYCLAFVCLFLVGCSSHVLIDSETIPDQALTSIATLTNEPTLTPRPSVQETPGYLESYPELRNYQKACNTPAGCAQLLVNRGWFYDGAGEEATYGYNFIPSPSIALRKNVGQCATVAFTIAAGLLDDGYAPTILVLLGKDYSHAIYVYQDKIGLWGYVQINRVEILFRPDSLVVDNHSPSFVNLNDLFSFYKENNVHGPEYYRYLLLTEKDFPTDWLTTDINLAGKTYTSSGP